MVAGDRWWEQASRRGATPAGHLQSSAALPFPVPPLGHISAPAAFLSHSSADKAIAREVCVELESHGLSCWIAPRDITPGTEWAAALVDGIERSRIMVVLLSTSSVGSDEVRREVERAYACRKPVVPVKIDASSLNGTLAYYLSEVHWVDLTRRPVRRHLTPLVARAQGLVGGALPSAPRPAPPVRHIPEVRLDRLF